MEYPNKLYRYMSYDEFEKYLRGEEIIGKKHKVNREVEPYQAICFLPPKTTRGYTPERAISFLGGVVTQELLVEFEVVKEYKHLIHKDKGWYADPDSDAWDDGFYVVEYSLPSYNNTILKVTAIKDHTIETYEETYEKSVCDWTDEDYDSDEDVPTITETITSAKINNNWIKINLT